VPLVGGTRQIEGLRYQSELTHFEEITCWESRLREKVISQASLSLATALSTTMEQVFAAFLDVPARFFVLESGCDGEIGRWRRSVRPQNKFMSWRLRSAPIWPSCQVPRFELQNRTPAVQLRTSYPTTLQVRGRS
jgi:hypothetical protein